MRGERNKEIGHKFVTDLFIFAQNEQDSRVV